MENLEISSDVMLDEFEPFLLQLIYEIHPKNLILEEGNNDIYIYNIL